MEVLDLFLDRYVRCHARVNAICTLAADSRKAAADLDAALARGEAVGPLHGLPVSFKDSCETKGLRTTCGYPPLRDHVPAQDSTVAARIRKAGGILFAKTNVPPLLASFGTDNEIFGRTNNPWNLGFSAGGSSGGSAAALAAGMTPLDIGSDMLGSIRIPAHFCGVAGIKPTQFRVSPVGHYPPIPGWPSAGNVLATRGPMARSIADLLLTFPVIAGFDPDDPESIPEPPEAAGDIPPSTLRIAWTDDFGGLPVTWDTSRVLERTARQLEGAGVRVEKAAPAGLDYERIWIAAGEIFTATSAYPMAPAERQAWADSLRAESHAGPLEKGFLQGVEGNLVSFQRALDARLQLISRLRAFFACWDAWLVPTACTPSFRHEDDMKPVTVGGRILPFRTALASHVGPFNLSGSPAVTLPAGFSADGLPIGLQLVGEPWRDLSLLRVAQVVEQAIGPLPSALI